MIRAPTRRADETLAALLRLAMTRGLLKGNKAPTERGAISLDDDTAERTLSSDSVKVHVSHIRSSLIQASRTGVMRHQS